MIDWLEPADAVRLAEIVRRLTGAADVEAPTFGCTEVGHRVINAVTRSLERLAGTRRVGEADVAWSLIRKTIQPVSDAATVFSPSNDPGHWNYWRREALAYDAPEFDPAGTLSA